MRFRRPQPDHLELNLAPMIDALLFIIVFFLLSTSFSSSGQLRLTLPEAQAPAEVTPPESLMISLDATGVLRVNQQVIPEGVSLTQQLQTVAGSNRSVPVIIQADGQTPHQAVVQVMDAVSQLGFTQLGIATQTPTPPAGQTP